MNAERAFRVAPETVELVRVDRYASGLEQDSRMSRVQALDQVFERRELLVEERGEDNQLIDRLAADRVLQLGGE